jgi:hypothetical protein
MPSMRIARIAALTALLVGVGVFAYAQRPQLTLDLQGANWEGDGATGGGLDAGLKGDRDTMVASAKNASGYTPKVDLSVSIPFNLGAEEHVTFEVGYRANAMQTRLARIYWNAVLVGEVDAFDGHEVLRESAFILPTDIVNVTPGEHTLTIEATATDNQWDFFQLDAVRITAGRESDPRGGILVPFEVVTFRDGNWAGDGNTWGGLDEASDMKGDLGVLRATARPGADARVEHAITLEEDFAGRDVRVTIGYRRNPTMARVGNLSINGDLIVTVTPFLAGDALGGADSVLAEASAVLPVGSHQLRRGMNTVTIEATDPGLRHAADFQIDAILFEVVPAMNDSIVPLASMGIRRATAVEPWWTSPSPSCARPQPASVAPLAHETTKESPQLVLQDPALVAHLEKLLEDKEDFQKRDAYLVRVDATTEATSVHVAALDPRGLVFGLSDLQTRLRRDKAGEVGLELPPTGDLLEVPAFDTRGEYVNIGYNQPQITPHEWSTERWEQYIDQLILSRLNTFYFYIWMDVYGLFPGSAGASSELNRNIHEGARHAIRYARSRGMRVHFMATPSYGPADIWRQHPEAHAEIEYVNHGFPAVCLSAPGAWERMKRIWAYEFDWFKEADVLQLWFYDPGGCFCEKNGCRANPGRDHGTSGARVRRPLPRAQPFGPDRVQSVAHLAVGGTHGALSRRLPPRAKEAVSRRHHRELTAVCAWGTSASLPTREHELGFGTSNFIFGSNPESGYFFLMPNLAFHQRVMRDLARTPYPQCVRPPA